MLLLSFFISCYLMRWSVSLLIGDAVVGQVESLILFGLGLLAAPLAAWSGVQLLLN